jgi:hypothetical protein
MSNQTKINCHGNIRYRYKVIACLVNTIKREKKLTVSPTHTSIETTNICILKDTWYHQLSRESIGLNDTFFSFFSLVKVSYCCRCR